MCVCVCVRERERTLMEYYIGGWKASVVTNKFQLIRDPLYP